MLSHVRKTLRGEEVSKIEKVVNLAEKVQIEDLYYNTFYFKICWGE